MKVNNLTEQPDASRKAAAIVQGMKPDERRDFVEALENATQVSDLPQPYKDYMEGKSQPSRNS